jgi:Raf kinase inhibitor-like YbhB/YbcL family protein
MARLGTLTIESSSFKHGGRIPDKHTANGEGTSPPLSWSGAPEGTTSFAVICHDPDAPMSYGFTHWVIYGIPADATELAEGQTDGYTAGKNGAGEGSFYPSTPPPGHGDHFYYFEIYALGGQDELPAGLGRAELMDRMEDSIIEQARVVGVFSR